MFIPFVLINMQGKVYPKYRLAIRKLCHSAMFCLFLMRSTIETLSCLLLFHKPFFLIGYCNFLWFFFSNDFLPANRWSGVQSFYCVWRPRFSRLRSSKETARDWRSSTTSFILTFRGPTREREKGGAKPVFLARAFNGSPFIAPLCAEKEISTSYSLWKAYMHCTFA